MGPAARTVALTVVTMLFFAANSLLARFALRSGAIDAGSFTAIRIGAGAAALALIVGIRGGARGSNGRPGSLRAGIALFCYAIAFSYAYLMLNAGTGALVLFAAVQMTMLGSGIARGEHPRATEWGGLALAFGGLIYLVLPGLAAPSPLGVMLMAGAGAAWGFYSIAARGIQSPVAATAGNFARAVPMAAGALLVIWVFGRPHANWLGAGTAAVSGAITSGLGYAIWYSALRGMRTSVAAIVQLTVPVLTAGAGVLLLGEQLTARLVVASMAILGGVALALLGKLHADKPRR
ncbi:DMT family transporter [Paludibaculum fermentans]|uniref:DMT family transporter n=1 Tax=Paludibaculum fermentans TaxID=1473598 RepID=UPI003EBE1ACA